MMFFAAMTAPTFSHSSHGMPMIYASGMNNLPKNHSTLMKSYPTSIPSQLTIEFMNATNDTKAIRLAVIPAMREIAVKAPFEAASNTELSVLIRDFGLQEIRFVAHFDVLLTIFPC